MFFNPFTSLNTPYQFESVSTHNDGERTRQSQNNARTLNLENVVKTYLFSIGHNFLKSP